MAGRYRRISFSRVPASRTVIAPVVGTDRRSGRIDFCLAPPAAAHRVVAAAVPWWLPVPANAVIGRADARGFSTGRCGHTGQRRSGRLLADRRRRRVVRAPNERSQRCARWRRRAVLRFGRREIQTDGLDFKIYFIILSGRYYNITCQPIYITVIDINYYMHADKNNRTL